MPRVLEAVLRAVYSGALHPWLLLRLLYWRRRILGLKERESDILRTWIRPGSTAVDVGGYNGSYTIGLAKCGAGRVIVFEPQPDAADRLRRAKLPKAVIHDVALSDREGMTEIVVPVTRYGQAQAHLAGRAAGDFGDARRIPVLARTLDSYELADVSFVKIDVEGHELSVLRGARRTIERERPVLLVEIESRHHATPVRDVIAEVEAMGYQAMFLDGNGELVSAERFDPVVHQREGLSPYPGVLRRNRTPYVLNFVFVPTMPAAASVTAD